MSNRPSQRIGTEVLFENDRIRVWEMTLAIGEGSGMHQHEHDYVLVYVTPSKIEFRQPSEAPVYLSCADGFVQYNVVGQQGMIHEIKNVGEETHRQILVEFLGPSRSDTPCPPETNGRST